MDEAPKSYIEGLMEDLYPLGTAIVTLFGPMEGERGKAVTEILARAIVDFKKHVQAEARAETIEECARVVLESNVSELGEWKKARIALSRSIRSLAIREGEKGEV